MGIWYLLLMGWTEVEAVASNHVQCKRAKRQTTLEDILQEATSHVEGTLEQNNRGGSVRESQDTKAGEETSKGDRESPRNLMGADQNTAAEAGDKSKTARTHMSRKAREMSSIFTWRRQLLRQWRQVRPVCKIGRRISFVFFEHTTKTEQTTTHQSLSNIHMDGGWIVDW